MSSIITGMGIGFGLLLALAIASAIFLTIVITLINIANGPLGRVLNSINNYSHNLTKKQLKKILQWIFFSPKKIRMLDEYLNTGMSMTSAYDKVVN